MNRTPILTRSSNAPYGALSASIIFPPFGHAFPRMRMRFFGLAGKAGPIPGILMRSLAICTYEARMKHVKVTELRQKLPEYMAKVRRGERFRVTSRGRVIAEIAPPAAAKDEAAAARARLRGSVRRYERPLDPVIDPGEWDANK